MSFPQWLEALLGHSFAILMLALGLIVGSFANVVIHRLPRGESVVRPGSRCPRCGHAVRPGDNLPVLSYLLLRGRCRDCGAAISLRYPLVELANGLAWLALAFVLGPTPRGVLTMALASALLILALIDFDHQILPDVITLPGIALGLIASVLPGSPLTFLKAGGAALGGYLAFGALAWLAKRYYRQEALGQGDWKLAALLGAWLGAEQLLLALLVGSSAGALYGGVLWALGRASGRSEMPLGTFLSLGGLVVIFVGVPFLAWYRGLLGG